MSERPAMSASGLPGKRVEAYRAGITITARMSAVDSISASDRDLMKRLTIVLAFIAVFTAVFAKLNHVYSQKFLATTGVAQWIFAQPPLSFGEPVAFFAARDFTLPAKRYYTRLKIATDPEYQLFVNGREIRSEEHTSELQ